MALGPVTTLVLAFVALSLLAKRIWEKIELALRSNWKYKFLNGLASYIHYGPDIGIKASLTLDDPTPDVRRRRLEGQAYLASKLGGNEEKTPSSTRGAALATSLVDCRFALAKVCMPLLRELEFAPKGRNFVVGVRNRNEGDKDGESDDSSAGGMLEVETEDGSVRPYVGNDAVHTLGIKAFYEPIQREINRRMALDGDDETSRLRFAPIALNSEIEKNVDHILELTGMDQVRYSLSGSEAMDAALKDVKASSNHKNVVVRFTSAYHGHVSGISFLDSPDHVFLPECTQFSIDFIERYHYRIAAVVVNPMQHFTGINKPSPPGEKVNHTRRVRSSVPRDEYARWLHSLQDKCRYCTKYLTKVAFVLDDIYFAFRTPELLSSKYFVHPDTGAQLSPDVMVLGKGVAAGYPLSAVVGRKGYLNTYDKKFLLKVNKTVGTLAAWHGGVVASNVFLEAILGKSVGVLKINAKEQLRTMVKKFDQFSESLNAQFLAESLPVRVRNFSNVFTMDYLNKSLYNSRYPQYLLAEGVFLGNYSTGKFNLSADQKIEDLKELEVKFVAAAAKAQRDGYFEPISSAAWLRIFSRLAMRFVQNYARLSFDQIMIDKHIDIEVSHNHPVNKFGHFWSSVFMILFAYPYMFWFGESLKGCAWFFATHVVRQAGHFFYEHQDRDIEKLKFGHKDASKKEAVAFLAVASLAYYHRQYLSDFVPQYVDPRYTELTLEQYVSVVALFTVVPHFVEITYEYGWLRGVSWALKIFTDPFTDLLDFYTHIFINPVWFLDLKDQRATYKLDIKTKKVEKVA